MVGAILKAMSKIAAIVPSFALQNMPILQVTIGDKIVETMGQSRRTKRSVSLPPPPPPSRPFIVGVFIVFNRYLEQRHNVAWRGYGRERFIPPF